MKTPQHMHVVFKTNNRRIQFKASFKAIFVGTKEKCERDLEGTNMLSLKT